MTTVERGGPVDSGSRTALDRAERQGAAPGAELPRPAGIESSPLGVRGRSWPGRRRTTLVLASAAALVAALHAGDALYLHAKARLGQALLQRAWSEARAGVDDARPWPWADMHPVARLRVPQRDVDVLVLAGANGRTLAWGPGHAESSALPGADGNAVITGHRDTHFAFLRDLAPGDRVLIETRRGETRSYRVERRFVADHRALRLPADDRDATLSLVTCWPFDGVDPGTPLRYAVVARRD
jgi:sortase A